MMVVVAGVSLTSHAVVEVDQKACDAEIYKRWVDIIGYDRNIDRHRIVGHGGSVYNWFGTRTCALLNHVFVNALLLQNLLLKVA